jgi:signal transduction histidine kinase
MEPKIDSTLAQAILLDRRVAFAIVDPQFCIQRVGGALQVLHRDPADLRGQSLFDLAPELVGSEPALQDILRGALSRLEVAWINRQTADGRMAYLTMVDLPHRDASGQIVGILHLMEDQTDAGSLKQQLSQSRNELRLAQDRVARQNLDLAAANAELRRLDDLKSTFVSVAAHELRTPLTSITGYLEMLSDEDLGPLSPDQHEYLDIVQGSAARLLQITSSLLDVTRIEAGRVDLVLQPTDLASLLRMVLAEFGAEAAAKGQHLILEESPHLPSALCDPARAAQILGNLISNAIKYTPEQGEIRAAVGLPAEEGFLQVSVSDNGVGIAAQEQSQLFSRFFRATGAAETGSSGTGLGLYIARSLAELHGGRIWLESEAGCGSTFHVTFPIAD